MGVLVKGPAGWAEYSPFPGYSDGNEPLAWQAAVSSATRPWPPAVRESVQVHATIPEVSAEKAAAMVAVSGCSAAKVKVGDDGEEARVEAVRHVLGPHGTLIVDANAAWDVDEALKRIRQLTRYNLDLVEQPVSSMWEMRRLRAAIEVPLAADESVRSPADAKSFAENEAADALVLKVQNMGGVGEALFAAELSGLPIIVSSLLETSVGIAAGLALAAALPELPYPCGLGTVGLLEGDVVADSLVPLSGVLAVRRPELDGSRLAPYECQLPVQPFPARLKQGRTGV